MGKGHELLVIPCVCPGFAGLVECDEAPGARCRGVAGARGIWGPPCSFVFSRGFVVMGGWYFTPWADVYRPGFIGVGWDPTVVPYFVKLPGAVWRLGR